MGPPAQTALASRVWAHLHSSCPPPALDGHRSPPFCLHDATALAVQAARNMVEYNRRMRAQLTAMREAANRAGSVA